MHILLSFLGVVATLLFVLHRLAQIGVSLGGLNPFWWRRRRAWRRKYETNPVFSLEDPKEIAALLVVGVAKIDGDMSREAKRALLAEFESTFGVDEGEAGELAASSAYLLGDVEVLRNQLDGVLGNVEGRLTPDQTESLLVMMERVASVDGVPTRQQRQLIDGVRGRLALAPAPQGTWG